MSRDFRLFKTVVFEGFLTENQTKTAVFFRL